MGTSLGGFFGPLEVMLWTVGIFLEPFWDGWGILLGASWGLMGANKNEETASKSEEEQRANPRVSG